ncbi:hypothetical protein D3C71_1666720 [compost metagenome]
MPVVHMHEIGPPAARIAGQSMLGDDRTGLGQGRKTAPVVFIVLAGCVEIWAALAVEQFRAVEDQQVEALVVYFEDAGLRAEQIRKGAT